MGCIVWGDRNGMDVLSGLPKVTWDVLSGEAEMAWDILSGVAILCGMFCLGWQK